MIIILIALAAYWVCELLVNAADLLTLSFPVHVGRR